MCLLHLLFFFLYTHHVILHLTIMSSEPLLVEIAWAVALPIFHLENVLANQDRG